MSRREDLILRDIDNLAGTPPADRRDGCIINGAAGVFDGADRNCQPIALHDCATDVGESIPGAGKARETTPNPVNQFAAISAGVTPGWHILAGRNLK